MVRIKSSSLVRISNSSINSNMILALISSTSNIINRTMDSKTIIKINRITINKTSITKNNKFLNNSNIKRKKNNFNGLFIKMF